MNSFLQREVSIMRQIRHPNVVQLFDVFETRTQVILVMELYVLSPETRMNFPNADQFAIHLASRQTITKLNP